MAAYQFPLWTGVMSESGGGSVTLNRLRVIFLTFSVIEAVLQVSWACLLLPLVRCWPYGFSFFIGHCVANSSQTVSLFAIGGQYPLGSFAKRRIIWPKQAEMDDETLLHRWCCTYSTSAIKCFPALLAKLNSLLWMTKISTCQSQMFKTPQTA